MGSEMCIRDRVWASEVESDHSAGDIGLGILAVGTYRGQRGQRPRNDNRRQQPASGIACESQVNSTSESKQTMGLKTQKVIELKPSFDTHFRHGHARRSPHTP